MNQSPKIFYLVRHALATHSRHGYGKRRFTAPILLVGIPAIQKLASLLKNVEESVNISSEIIRCRETSAIITQVSGKKFLFDSRLNEGGYTETVKEIEKRVKSFINDIVLLPQRNIIICTHGKIIAAIKHLVLDGAYLAKDTYDYSQTGELMIIKGKAMRTINFN